MIDDYIVKTITDAFKLVCRKCGSHNVVLDIQNGINYGGQTGYQEGHLTIGCNECKQNDVQVSL